MTSRHRILVWLILLAGFAVRLPHVADPPLKFHGTRQYRSAIMARGYYLSHLRGVDAAEVNAARAAAAAQGLVEPPVMERLAAWAYRVTGREALWIPRLLSVLAWTGGGAALAWLAASLLSPPAAVAAAGLYMFLPFGITASQAFLPDPLMVALAVLTVAAALNRDRGGSWLLYLIAAIAATLIKPMAMLMFGPVALVLAVQRHGLFRGFSVTLLEMVAILLPGVLYYYFGTQGVLENRFLSHLLLEPAFWQNWGAMIHRVVGWPFVLAGLAGVAVGFAARPFLFALWFGYGLLGLALPYPIESHNYYSLPLVPIVALSTAALVDAVRRAAPPAFQRTLAFLAITALIVGAGVSARAAEVFQSADDLHAQVARYQRIGEVVGHSTRVASLDFDTYGFAINYHGFINSTNWPLSIDLALAQLSGQPPVPIEQRIAGLKDMDFFVATSQDELEQQPGLQAFLDARLLIARDGSPDDWRFVVYDLRQPGMTVDPPRISLVEGFTSSVLLRTTATTPWRIENADSEDLDISPVAGVGTATLLVAARSEHAAPAAFDSAREILIYSGESRSPLGRFTVRLKAPGPTLGDYDADGKADLIVYRPADAKWYALSSTSSFTKGTTTALGASNDLPVPGDYDGDGHSDFAVYRGAEGTWLVRQSSTGSDLLYHLGGGADVPVPADYDGDGKTDVAVFRPSTGVWSILESSRGGPSPVTIVLGGESDIPVPGDYDGDGKADLTVFHPSTGIWTIQSTRAPGALMTRQWGLSGDIPVPGDYDGDGRTDLAVFRPPTGRWYIRHPSIELQFGLSGDIPAPADYDGDGKTDLAVWRPSSGIWYIRRSTTRFENFTTTTWGRPGDVPILGRH